MSGTALETPAVAPAAATPATLIPDPAAAVPVVADPAKPAVPAEVKAVEAPKAPEKYDFKFPEGVTPNQPLIEGFTELAKASNLTQEQADKYVALYTKHQAEEKAASDKAYADARAEWIKTAQNDPEIGGAKYDESLVFARTALKAEGNSELESLLLQSGFEAHPAVLKHFLWIARKIGEDRGGGMSVGSDGTAGESYADAFYRKANKPNAPKTA